MSAMTGLRKGPAAHEWTPAGPGRGGVPEQVAWRRGPGLVPAGGLQVGGAACG